MKYIKTSISFFVIYFFLFISASAQENAKEIFKKATSQLPNGNLEMEMEIKTTDAKGRIKEKSIHILIGKFGETEKTKVSWLKPERAKGTTVIISKTGDETGIVDVYTPSNGKVRKMKATPANLKAVGSEFNMTGFISDNTKDLNYKYISTDNIDTKECHLIEVNSKTSKEVSKAEIWIEQSANKILQVKIYNEKGDITSIMNLSDYQAVPNASGKIQPMQIINNSIENKKTTEIQVAKIQERSNLTEDEFSLPVPDKTKVE
jgi:outer membrane lipoprotein-sorting protein